ncbi:MAG: tetratricopeptide repeat protein [Planctomycetia bacterium]
MKKMLDPKTVLLTTALLCLAAPTFAQRMHVTGSVPARPAPQNASWNDTLKASFNKLTNAIIPEKKEPERFDELSLSRKATASPDLHVALAQACEQKGETQNAIIEYEKALKLNPKHEETLLQYARFYDRISQPEKSDALYKEAANLHPRSARVFNHQGLFFVRHKRFNEAAKAFLTAVTLEPMKESYRGNLSVVLVDLGKYKEAYNQLRAIQSADMAYYNLGYLLQERGKKAMAIKHFQVALTKNPNHQEAQIWLNHLLEEQKNDSYQFAAQEPPQQQGAPPNLNPPIQQNQPPIQQHTVTPQPQISRQAPPLDPQPNIASLNPPIQNPQPNLGNPPITTPIQTPPQQKTVEQKPTVQEPIQNELPWQPQMPPEMTGPVRTYPHHYRPTIPPANRQPYAIPDPSLTGPNSMMRNRMAPPTTNGQGTVQPQNTTSPSHTQALPPVQPTTPDMTQRQGEAPSLVAPTQNQVIARRLPPTSPRRTVNTASDRYITPLPPVDWSEQFKEQQQ